jgi:hypothetical protein
MLQAAGQLWVAEHGQDVSEMLVTGRGASRQ